MGVGQGEGSGQRKLGMHAWMHACVSGVLLVAGHE